MPNPNISTDGAKTRWEKGQSGNPKGRPPKLPELDRLLDEVLGDEKDGITAAKAVLMALRAKAIKGDVRACEVLLNRAYGKAKEYLDLSSKEGIKLITDLVRK